MSSNTLRHYALDHPEWINQKQRELGVQVVKVSDIIGGNPFASKHYSNNWEPNDIEFDRRYQRVERLVKEAIAMQKNVALDLGYIHLFKVYSEELGKCVYYVCMDGHRRVSNCHRLGVDEIKAKVTELI